LVGFLQNPLLRLAAHPYAFQDRRRTKLYRGDDSSTDKEEQHDALRDGRTEARPASGQRVEKGIFKKVCTTPTKTFR